MPETQWIKVYETVQLHRAVMIQSILGEHHIEAVILNEQDSSFVIVGEISVYVSPEDAVEAMSIIEELMEE